MKNLYFSPSENIIFWITGCTADDTGVAIDKARFLVEYAKEFANATVVPLDMVFTFYITNSPRYRKMRVFWAEVEAGFIIPEGTFTIGRDSTMNKWIGR
jgi:hypothetical protein